MTPQDEELIDRIFQIRVVNNLPWKKLIRIAFRYSPDEARAALREVNDNDKRVSDLVGELTK